jgi:hypothetical protein
VAVVVVNVGEHLHDLGLFLFQTSAIQHKYSRFRDFQVRIHPKNFLYESQHQQLGKTVISRVPDIQKVYFIWLESLRNYLQLLFRPDSQIMSLCYSKHDTTETVPRFQTAQKLYLETAISHKPDQICG